MKNKIVLFLLLISSLAFGQVPRVFTGKCNISQTGSGAGYWQVGVTNFDSPGGVYDAGDITVNDKLYFNDSGILYTLNITTIVSASGTNATIRVSNVGVTGISSVPTSAAEISRGTANYKFVPWTANMTDNDNQIVNEHSWYLADSLLAIQAAKGNITQGTLVAASASRTVPMNGQDLTFDNADDIRLEATGEYFIGSGSGDLPTLDSDNNGFDLGLGSSNEMVLHQRAADQVLSKAGAPVNGTDVAWYVGQLLVNTVDGSVYRATAKSTNPDFFGTGSTWSMLPTGATSGVTTFESRTGTVTSAAGDYTASEVTNVPAGTISGSTVQAAIDELATEKASVDSISAHRTDINNLQVLTGRVDGSTNMGTYTGTTIPDNQSVKQNVQSLETAIEGVLPKDITTFGYNPLTRVVTLGKSDGGTITGAVTEIVFVTAAPTGTPAFPVAIDTVGTDTMYVANNGAWVRFASGGGTISQPAGQVVYGTGASVASSANLFWDASNNRLGIGTNTPGTPLQISNGGRDINISPNHGGFGGTVIFTSTGGLALGSAGSYSTILDANQNLMLGTTAGASARLHVKGSGATSATASLYAENSTGNPILKLTDDNVLSADPDVNGTGTMMAGYTNGFHLSGGAGFIYAPSQQLVVNSGYPKGNLITAAANSQATTSYSTATISQTFSPTATGTNTFTSLTLTPTINQTGGHTGNIIGLDYNPTLTSVGGTHYAAAFRSGKVDIGVTTNSVGKLNIESGVNDLVGLNVISNNTSNNGYAINLNRASTGVQNAFNFSTATTPKWFLGQDNDATDDFMCYSWASNKHIFKAFTATGDIGFGSAFNILYVNQTSNKVGVGTQLPATNLEVKSSVGNDVAISMNTTDVSGSGAAGGLRFANNGSNKWGIIYSANTYFGLYDYTASDYRMYVNNSGQVGFGNTNPSSKVEITSNGIGTTQANSTGLSLVNSTAATVGAQQVSPALRWRGNGWKTDATAASQTVDVMADVLPVQGAAAPSGEWRLRGSINGGAYSTILTTNTNGNTIINTASSATEKLLTLNRSSAQTINNETKLAFALAGTDVGVMSSKREAASDYSLNFTTLQGGLANSVPGIHVGANNRVGINQDTAVYQMDVKGANNHIRALSTSATATISLDNSTTGSSGGDIIQSGNNLLFSYPGYVDFSSTASSTKGITISEEGVFFLKNYNSTEATAITVANGQIIYVSSTGGVFTSVGFWGRENGAWVKL